MWCSSLSVFLAGVILAVAPVSHAAILDVRQPPYSAVGDGKADDRGALAAAFSDAKAGDTVFVPAGEYRVAMGKGRLMLPDGVTFAGQSGRSSILVASEDGKPEHREFLQPGSSCLIQGLSFSRVEDFPAVMFPLFGERDGIVFRDCVFDGGTERFPAHYCHAFQVGNGALKNLVLEKIELRGFSFGLFQPNGAKGSVEKVTVRQSLFERNRASDLEFNSPNGRMADIKVTDCVFRDNLSDKPSGGFAVGFANVVNGRVERCRIENYGAEALHVEDRSKDITLAGNTIVRGSHLQTNGVILVVNDSRNVVVEGNYIDGRGNTNKVHLVLVTAGGPKFTNPSGVVIRNNVLLNGPATTNWYLQKGSGPDPEGNIGVPVGN